MSKRMMRTVTTRLAGVSLLAFQPLLAQIDSAATDGGATEPARYRISAEETEVVIYVFRGGALARFGHNHVISANGIEGTITLQTDGAPSTFVLRIPVDALDVDDPDLRREAGDDFASVPSAADIAGTRDNMLGRRVLHAAEYPTLTVSGTTEDADNANVTFEVKQHTAEKAVPIETQVTDQSIRVTGTLELSHEELGLRPFRALAGALRVAEIMQVSFDINAIREE